MTHQEQSFEALSADQFAHLGEGLGIEEVGVGIEGVQHARDRAVIDRLDAEILLDAGALGLDRRRVAKAVDHDIGAFGGEGKRD